VIQPLGFQLDTFYHDLKPLC